MPIPWMPWMPLRCRCQFILPCAKSIYISPRGSSSINICHHLSSCTVTVAVATPRLSCRPPLHSPHHHHHHHPLPRLTRPPAPLPLLSGCKARSTSVSVNYSTEDCTVPVVPTHNASLSSSPSFPFGSRSTGLSLYLLRIDGSAPASSKVVTIHERASGCSSFTAKCKGVSPSSLVVGSTSVRSSSSSSSRTSGEGDLTLPASASTMIPRLLDQFTTHA